MKIRVLFFLFIAFFLARSASVAIPIEHMNYQTVTGSGGSMQFCLRSMVFIYPTYSSHLCLINATNTDVLFPKTLIAPDPTGFSLDLDSGVPNASVGNDNEVVPGVSLSLTASNLSFYKISSITTFVVDEFYKNQTYLNITYSDSAVDAVGASSSQEYLLEIRLPQFSAGKANVTINFGFENYFAGGN